MPDNDPQIWVQARQRLPLPALMTRIGDGAYAKPSTTCPFCERKNKFGIFLSHGRHKFKCHHTGCVANEPEHGRNEVGYLALRKNLAFKDACTAYLELAVPEILAEQRAEHAARKVSASSGSAPPSPDGGLDGKPQNPWHDLWQRLALNAEDRAKIRENRGLSDEAITRAGIRSNNQSNLFQLQALAEDWTLPQLIAEGIYKSDERNIRPQGQLYGYGITDQKGPDGKRTFAVTEPPLIPYFDLKGIPFYIRPHKGGVTRPKDEHADIQTFENEDDGRTCASHPYCPPRLKELIEINDGLVVFTEGEWKALACEECDIPAIACPGITFIRNPVFRRELIGLLTELRVYDMVVIFDNEDKGNAEFSERFVADPWQREETQVYAEIVAIELRDYFQSVNGTCSIGVLPDELRERGKADFDGVLAKLIKEHGRADGIRMARRVFQETISKAGDIPYLDLFPSQRRRIIEWRREQLFHRPLIPMGGDAEAKLAQRFGTVNPETGKQVDDELASLYRSLRGCYYERGKGKTVAQSQFDQINDEIANLEKATDAQAHKRLTLAYAARAALWERRKGLPKTISDFTLKCEYKLITTDGTHHRLVNVRNKMQKGKTEKRLYRLAPEHLARCSNFREWCYGMGEAVWKGGEIALQELVEDMDHHSFQRKIVEVDLYGQHSAADIWFYGDCAWKNGECIHPDERGIFWHEGVGYQIDTNQGEIGNAFSQGAPLMLSPQGGVKPLATPNVGEMFARFSQDMFDTIGGYDGWLMIGMTLAYGIAPELLRRGGHPGLFLYGPLSGGKTSIARWLCQVWGFKELKGINLVSSTPVAMNRVLTQYSCLPLWFEEFRRLDITDQKESVIRQSFDRGHSEKGVASPTKRTQSVTPMTTPLITGENSSRDSATRSRYGHVMVSLNRRIGDGKARYDRVQNESRHYYLFGQYIMRHRPDFVTNALAVLDQWMSDPDVKKEIVNERVRLVHGVAYAAFTVMADMLEVADPVKTQEYEVFLIEHARKALLDVVEEGFLTTFWREVLSAIQRGQSTLSQEFFAVEYKRLADDGSLKECKAEDPKAIHVLYIAPTAVYGAYEKDLRSRGKEPPHGENDLRRELERESYWIPNPRNAERVHRRRIKGQKTTCWVISLERASRLADGEEDETAPYLFPFAEDFISMKDAPPKDGNA